jgi:WD40 repeat protein
MKKLSCCLILVLAACAPQPAAPPAPTETSAPATFTATAEPTATDTLTPLPTETSTLPPTATNSPTPRLAIHSGNAGRLVPIRQLTHPDVHSLAFSPDSTGLLIASGDPSRGNFLASVWQPDQDQKHDLATAIGTVWDAAFSPDGRWVAYVVDNQSNSVRGYVVDVQSKSQIATQLGDGTAYCLAFSPDGTRLALGGLGSAPNGAIWLYDTATWEMIRTFTVNRQKVLDLVFSPDGLTLYSSGTDGSIRAWTVADGTLASHFTYGNQANRIALSPDGSLLVSIYCTKSDTDGCVKGGVVIWTAPDGKMLKSFDDIATSVAFSPDGGLLATGGGPHDSFVRFRYTATWGDVGQVATMAESLAFSPDGRLLATADYEMVTVWAIQ